MQNQFNPFNGMKALVHVEYWNPIVDQIIPPPRLVSIDPCAFCNYDCCFCNAKKAINNNRMTTEIMKDVVRVLNEFHVRAVCIGGGGESLLNLASYDLIDMIHDNNIEIGVITNGSVIFRYESLLKCKWIAFSIDAAKASTYSKIKGTSTENFNKVIQNIKLLVNKGVEISYKFLIHPENYLEIYESAKLAKDLGCNLIHIRPGAEPWFKNDKSWHFSNEMILTIKKEIEMARQLENDNFKVYGITDKFNLDFTVKNNFKKCYACFTTCFIDSNGDVGLCCDRRGDSRLMLCNIKDIHKYWGSSKHLEMQRSIEVSECPRCTYSHVNEIFEYVIIKDKMGYNLF